MSDANIKSFLVQDEPMNTTDWIVDVVIVLGAFGFGCLQLTLAINLVLPDEALRRFLGVQALAPTAFAITAIAATTIPLVFRRKLPWPVLGVTLLLWLYYQVEMETISLSMIGPLVALFTLSFERGRLDALVAGVATAVVCCVATLLTLTSPAHLWTLTSLTLVQNLAFVVGVGFAGFALHSHRSYLEAAEQRAVQAELTKETEAQMRVEEERVRIAREVHDITAHSLSAVSIQAAVAERMIDSDPEAAKEAIGHVRSISKKALGDMRAMIGVLRSGDAAGQRSPTEGTDCIVDLVEYLKDAHVTCDLNMRAYDRARVPAHIDVTLYGIAREACTNIVRHAHAHHATIKLSIESGFAVLVIEDDGIGIGHAMQATSGHGVRGMQERACVLKGSCEISARSAGGTKLEVRIPLSDTEIQIG